MHGRGRPRTWVKIPLAIGSQTRGIVAEAVIDKTVEDSKMINKLLDTLKYWPREVIANGSVESRGRWDFIDRMRTEKVRFLRGSTYLQSKVFLSGFKILIIFSIQSSAPCKKFLINRNRLISGVCNLFRFEEEAFAIRYYLAKINSLTLWEMLFRLVALDSAFSTMKNIVKSTRPSLQMLCIQLLEENGLQYLLVAKSEDHQLLFDTVEVSEEKPGIRGIDR